MERDTTTGPSVLPPALRAAAPRASAALDAVVATARVEADRAGVSALVADVAALCGATHGIPPLPVPGVDTVGRRGPVRSWRDRDDLTTDDRAVLAFAEQFTVDVAGTTDELRAGLGDRAGLVAPLVWVCDVVPRVVAAAHAALPPVEGSPGTATPPAPDPDGIWAALDRFVRAVPGLDRLDPVTTELVRLRGASQHRCRVCASRRSRSAVLAGADEAAVAAVDRYATSDLPSHVVAALAWTDAMLWTPGALDGAVVGPLSSAFDPGQRAELILDVARNALNKVAVALAADAPRVAEGVELFDVTPDGELVYGLTLE